MLASRDWVYWSSLFGPILAYNLALKLRCLARLDDQPDELYDLSQDTLERVNLAAERRDLVRRRRMETLAWRSAMLALYDVDSR